MDREIAPEIRRKVALKKYVTLGTVFAIMATGFYGLNSWLSPKIERDKIRTAIVEIGDVEASFTASGLVVPESEQIITSPISSKIKRVLKNAGEAVSEGEPILELDIEFLKTELETLQDEYALKQNKKTQLTLALERQKSELNSRQDIKALNIQFLETRVDKEKRLEQMGLGTKTKLEQAELELAIAMREMQLLQEQNVNQEQQLQVDLHELELELKIQKKRIAELEKTIDLAQTPSEYGGVLTWVNTDVGSTITRGETIAKVANLSSFKVEAQCSDVYADRIAVGGSVRVRINETDLPGFIDRVRPEVKNGMITFLVGLDEEQDALLKPNLRVDVFVITSASKQVARVKNGPFYQGGTYQKVFVVEGDRAVAREVAIGATNFDYVEIKKGIIPEEKIIISDMEEYLHHDEITLK